ncbi:MAG: hypothetical protein U9R17_10455 [Thermodesulfobacteriota bacterium]|nr:hypothetical protein [Thermodesulfobacteriota bacterium]
MVRIFKTLVLILLFLLPCMDSFAQNVVTVKGVPKIKVDMLIYDFGQVNQGQAVIHDFIVHNQGNAVLEIKNVKPG